MKDSLRSAGLMGRGGQGIVYAVSILAKTLFEKGYYVAQLQSYGAEVRGGSVLAYVVYSRDRIINPFIEGLDALVILYKPPHNRMLLDLIEKSNRIIIDETQHQGYNLGRKVYTAPLISSAFREGYSDRLGMVALGCLARISDISITAIENTIPHGKSASENKAALNLGYTLCSKAPF